MNEKNVKTAKQTHVFKGYAGWYNAEISFFFFFDPELQLNNIKSAVKNKLRKIIIWIKIIQIGETLV